jgi:hypothetical protein
MPTNPKHQRKSGFHRYLRTKAAHIATILIFLAGLGLLVSYILAPPIEIAPPQEGFGTAMSNAVNVDTLQLELDTQQSNPDLHVEIIIHLSYVPPNEQKPAYVMLVLPFRVNSVTLLNSQRWNVINASKVVATMIYTEVSNDSLHLNSTAFSVELHVDRTFEFSQRDIYRILLPFGSLTGLSEYFPEVDQVTEQLGIGIRSPPAKLMNIYVTLPWSAENVQAFPDPTTVTPYYVGNRTQVSVEWVLTEAQAITLSYNDSFLRWNYETRAILGSLFVGVGASGGLDWVEECSKRRD